MPKGVYRRTKPVWNKGLTKADDRVQKYIVTRSKNPIWVINQKEFCRKLGKSSKGRPSNRKGCRLTDEQKIKCGVKPANWSERCKQVYKNNPELRKLRAKQAPSNRLSKDEYRRVCIKIQDTVIKNYNEKPEIKLAIRAKRLLQVLPIKDTKIERLLQGELTKRNIAFVTHPAIDICQPDILLEKYKILIFADGCYWHGCKIHGKGYNPNSKKDKFFTKYLLGKGYKVFRFWEHDILQSPSDCIDKVVQYAKKLGKETHLVVIK